MQGWKQPGRMEGRRSDRKKPPCPSICPKHPRETQLVAGGSGQTAGATQGPSADKPRTDTVTVGIKHHELPRAGQGIG